MLNFAKFPTRLHHCCRQPSKTLSEIKINDQIYIRDDWTTINENIIKKLDKKLLNKKNHPLEILKNKIKDFYAKNSKIHGDFEIFENLPQTVSTFQNFDSLLVPGILRFYRKSS